MSRDSLTKVAAYIKEIRPARYNIVWKRLEHPSGKEWTDRDTNNLRLELCQQDFKVSRTDLDTILESDTIPTYNPFDEFFLEFGSKAVDQKIIDKVIDTLPLKVPEVRPLIRKWLLQIPAAMGGKANLRLALVLIGPQDSGKTEWLRRLLPNSLKQDFTEFSGSKSHKDTQIQLAESLMILDDEFNHISHHNQTDVKRLLSGDMVRIRRPYSRNAESLKRRAVVCATTNDMQILSDPTGNTRLIPVEITGRYDFDAFNNIDKNKLLVALNREFLANTKSSLLDDDLRQVLSDVSLHYNKENQELEFLHDKLDFILKSEQMMGKGFITASDVVLFAKSEYQITLRQHAVGSALKKKFGSRKTFNTADGPRKGYDFNSKSQ